MLSQAQPLTHLFDTIDSEPLNYIKAIQEVMVAEPSVPPEYQELKKTKAITHYKSAFNKSVTLDLKKIDENSVKRYRSAFHIMAEFVKEKNMGIKFHGLKEAVKKYTKKSCCTWSCRHKPSPKRELLQLLSAIKSQSKSSSNGYVIEVISN